MDQYDQDGVVLQHHLPKIEHSENIKELATALAKAQMKITDAGKDALNTHFKVKYTTLSAAFAACRGPLAEQGIAIIQGCYNAGSDIGVWTMLTHSSGQWMRCYLHMRPFKYDTQGAGSVITYLRRYLLMAMTGVAPDDDDDGEGAVGHRELGSSQYAQQRAPVVQHVAGAGPKPSGEKEKAREDFIGLKKAIIAAPHDTALKALKDVSADKLANIKAHSPEGYEQLIELFKEKEKEYGE